MSSRALDRIITMIALAMVLALLWCVNRKVETKTNSEKTRFAQVDYRINTLRDRLDGFELGDVSEEEEPAPPKQETKPAPVEPEIQPFNA